MIGVLCVFIIFASKCFGVDYSYITRIYAIILLLILQCGVFHQRDGAEFRYGSVSC
jgi:TctA family transporter